MCFAPQRRALFRHLNLPKVARTCGGLYMFTSKCVSRHNGVHFFDISTFQKWSENGVLYILTSKCASRHNGVHFCDISTSKSGPTLVCFAHFDFEMCFVFRVTMACTFSTSQLPKVVRTPGAFNMLTSKCASRHNGVQLFTSHLASWLRTGRFSEPTFRPSGAPNHWENTVFRDFPTVSRICICFLLIFSLLLFFLLIFLFSLPFPCSAFHLSILSEV